VVQLRAATVNQHQNYILTVISLKGYLK